MKKFCGLLTGLFLFFATACVAATGTDSSSATDKKITPETLVSKAESAYAGYLAEPQNDAHGATQKTAEYLRGLAGIKEVTVRGDNLFVIMEDGNELLIMLGKDRL